MGWSQVAHVSRRAVSPSRAAYMHEIQRGTGGLSHELTPPHPRRRQLKPLKTKELLKRGDRETPENPENGLKPWHNLAFHDIL